MSDKLTVILHTDTQEYTIQTDAQILYERCRNIIPSLLNFGDDKKGLMMKLAVKGLFIAWGDTILEQIFKSKEHPRPGKSDDVVAWYIDLFTQVLINQAMKTEVVLTGAEESADSSIQITKVHTRPAADCAQPAL